MQLYFGGHIYTLKEENEKVEAVLVHNGRIVQVGQTKDLLPLASEHIDLKGTTMIPGIVDSHLHLIGYGEKLARVQLADAKNKHEMVKLLQQTAAQLTENEWLIAEGWNEYNLENEQMLTLQELDAITHNPVILHRACRHVMLVNSTVLDMAQITDDREKPAGGVIGKDKAGRLNGYLYEEATQLALSLLPTEGEEYKKYLKSAIKRAVKSLHSYGIVGAHSEDCAYYGDFMNVVDAYEQTIGVNHNFRIHLLRHHKVFEAMEKAQLTPIDGFLEYGAMKIFADGSFGGSTAALLEPYCNEELNKGVLVHSYEQFEQYVQIARQHNEAIAVHVIGDAAAQLFIEMVEKYPAPSTKRDRLIHACLLNEVQIEKLKKIPNLITDIQPTFVPSDFPWIEDKLGEHRMRYTYAWKTLRALHPAIGTDAPIEHINPFVTIAAAVKRNEFGKQKVDEALTVFEAVKMYTHGSAYAIGKEHERGLIEKGYVADFTVLSQNIFEAPINSISNTRATMTIVDGNIVYYNNL